MKTVNIKVHFIGIGGISMSALALYLKSEGFIVSGSDSAANENIADMSKSGISILPYNDPTNVIGKDIIVYSSAIQKDNEELIQAEKLKITIIKRAELLRLIGLRFEERIGIAGSHGKTTVTSLISHIFKASGEQFTAHIGGFDKIIGNYFSSGKKWLVSEVCEFEKNINYFNPTVAVVLNIDNDHMNSYLDMQDLVKTFFAFLDKARLRIVCADDKLLTEYNKPKITYGLKKGDYYVKNVSRSEVGNSFDIYRGKTFLFRHETLNRSEYFIYNILAATATCVEEGVSIDAVSKGLKTYSGVFRRNEYLGQMYNSNIYADYCHHPTEIKAYLSSVRPNNDDLVIFEPHTYSRTELLFQDFIDALEVCKNLIIYKTFAAREAFSFTGSGERLAKNIPGSIYVDNLDTLINRVKIGSFKNIYVLGAGSLYGEFKNHLKKSPI